MRTFATGAVLVAAALVLAMPAATAPTNSSELLKDERHFLAQSKKTYTGGQKAAKIKNMEVVGQNDLGEQTSTQTCGYTRATPMSATGGSPTGRTDRRRASARRRRRTASRSSTLPIRPTRSGLAARQPDRHLGGGRDRLPGQVRTPGRSRHRGGGPPGLRWLPTRPSFPRGVMLFDVTSPASPVQLGFLSTGCCTRGLHELEFAHRDDLERTFVYASVPASEYEEEGSPSGFRDLQGRGDFRLIDVTNPAVPFAVSDWGVIHDAGGPLNRVRAATLIRSSGTAPSRPRTGSSRSWPTGTAASSRSI